MSLWNISVHYVIYVSISVNNIFDIDIIILRAAGYNIIYILIVRNYNYVIVRL